MKKFIILVLLSLSLLYSCSIKNDIIVPLLQIPPSNYYTLFINNFEKNYPINISDTNYVNWYNSKLKYQYWKNNLNAFSLTFKALYLMNYQSSNSFDEYTEYREVKFDTNNISYKFILYSSVNSNNDVEWEMQQFTNNSSKYIVALKGTNSKMLDKGTWTFYQTQNSNIAKLRVYWKETDSLLMTIFSEIDSSQIETSFFKITENYFENNNIIKIENFDFYLKKRQLIELYKEENIGRIQDTNYYKDKKLHYWTL